MTEQIAETLIENAAVSRYPDQPSGVWGNEQRSDESYAFESGAHWGLETARTLLRSEAEALAAPKRDDEEQTAFAMRLVRAEHLRRAADLITVKEG